jgi:hypothetical protein
MYAGRGGGAAGIILCGSDVLLTRDTKNKGRLYITLSLENRIRFFRKYVEFVRLMRRDVKVIFFPQPTRRMKKA